jgi:hypothetical protein
VCTQPIRLLFRYIAPTSSSNGYLVGVYPLHRTSQPSVRTHTITTSNLHPNRHTDHFYSTINSSLLVHYLFFSSQQSEFVYRHSHQPHFSLVLPPTTTSHTLHLALVSWHPPLPILVSCLSCCCLLFYSSLIITNICQCPVTFVVTGCSTSRDLSFPFWFLVCCIIVLFAYDYILLMHSYYDLH